MKILNLYAGIGGNRKLWINCDITAVEYNSDIAKIYQHFFPNDNMIIKDAHEYLLNHYSEYDFIWASPPCQTHSSFRQNLGVRYRGVKAVYPDMRLYQEIIFLQANFKGKWIVENVKPYYKPLINPTILMQRHLFWTNIDMRPTLFDTKIKLRSIQIPELQSDHGFDISKFNIKDKRQILRNCVNPEIGKYIMDCI